MSMGGTTERIAIVGAGLAGLRGAEALRGAGFEGRLAIIGEEAHRPYDRPPLSKRVLTGEITTDRLGLPGENGLRAEWHLGQRASRLDMRNREIELDGGGRVEFDKLLIATGARARPWSNAGEAKLDGVFTLRGREDAESFAAALASRPKRVLVIGGGFIGCEVASACRELRLPVTMVDPSPTPLARLMGSVLGKVLVRVMRSAGVELCLGTTATELEGTAGRVRRARLSNGKAIDAEVVLVAMGATRDLGWLQGSGLAADSRGITCDGFCRALDPSGKVVDGVFAAGDVARWPHPLYGGRLVTLEHWGNAVEQSAVAAQNMTGRPEAWKAYSHLPAFWSSQFGLHIKSLGLTDSSDQMVIAQGNPRDNRFVAAFGGKGRTLAAVSFNSARWLPAYAEPIQRGAPFPPIQNGVESTSSSPVSPGFPPARRTT
jgi:NADPH-dependent 2,4-dienoyl-CoA reductase/sulfur reductase-like enzyme